MNTFTKKTRQATMKLNLIIFLFLQFTLSGQVELKIENDEFLSFQQILEVEGDVKSLKDKCKKWLATGFTNPLKYSETDNSLVSGFQNSYGNVWSSYFYKHRLVLDLKDNKIRMTIDQIEQVDGLGMRLGWKLVKKGKWKTGALKTKKQVEVALNNLVQSLLIEAKKEDW